MAQQHRGGERSRRSGWRRPSPRCPAPSRGPARTGPCRRRGSPTAAARAIRRSAPASSDRMSPNMFSVSDDVEARGREREFHRGGVDEHVIERHVGIVARDLGHHRAPQARHFEHVGLVDRRQRASDGPRESERAPARRARFRARVAHRVDGGRPVGRDAARLAVVQPAGQLAHDEHVGPAQHVWLERTRGSRARATRAPAAGSRTGPARARTPSSAASGRSAGARSSNAGSPTAPSRMASADFAAASVAAGSGGSPPQRRPADQCVGELEGMAERVSPTRAQHLHAPLRRPPARCRRPASGRYLRSHAESVSRLLPGVARRRRRGQTGDLHRIGRRSSSETCFFAIGQRDHARGRPRRARAARASGRTARSGSARRAGRSACRARASSAARRRPRAA